MTDFVSDDGASLHPEDVIEEEEVSVKAPGYAWMDEDELHDFVETFGTLTADDGEDWLEGRQGVPLPPDGKPYRPFELEHPVEALDIHLRQWSWMSTPDAQDVLQGFLRAYQGLPDNEVPDGRPFQRALEDTLNRATTSYVSVDVAELVKQQGLAMPPDMLQSTDVPYKVGFAVLGRCWPYMDYDQGTYVGKIPIRAICWWEGPIRQPAPDEDPGNELRMTQPGAEGTKPGIMMALFGDWDWVEAVAPNNVEERPSKPPLFLVDLIAWSYDTWWVDVGPGEKPDQHHQNTHCGEFRRMLLTLFRFMNEEIVRTERARLPRPARRRLERAHKANTPEDGCIVSVHLRRYAQKVKATVQEEREAAEIWWSHRWWVRGHHRFNPKTGQKDIWVRPHLKPNDDTLPIVLKEKLVSVDR